MTETDSLLDYENLCATYKNKVSGLGYTPYTGHNCYFIIVGCAPSISILFLIWCFLGRSYSYIQVTPTIVTPMPRTFLFKLGLWHATTKSLPFFPGGPRFLNPKYSQIFGKMFNAETNDVSLHYLSGWVCSFEGLLSHYIGLGCDQITSIAGSLKVLTSSLIISTGLCIASILQAVLFCTAYRTIYGRVTLLFLVSCSAIVTAIGAGQYLLVIQFYASYSQIAFDDYFKFSAPTVTISLGMHSIVLLLLVTWQTFVPFLIHRLLPLPL